MFTEILIDTNKPCNTAYNFWKSSEYETYVGVQFSCIGVTNYTPIFTTNSFENRKRKQS